MLSNVVHKVEEVQRAPDLLMHKVLEEVQRSTDSIHKLLEQAQTNGFLVVNADKSKKLNKSLKEGNHVLFQRDQIFINIHTIFTFFCLYFSFLHILLKIFRIKSNLNVLDHVVL